MPDFIEAGRTHVVAVESVTDGDTVDVRFDDGSTEEVRLIGVDTPETERNRRFERPPEWEGIEDPQTLIRWGERGTAYARDRLGGATVTLSFDPSEPVRDKYGRLLGYLEYDHDGEPAFYNRDLLEAGLARVYDSGVTNHDAFRAAERAARAVDRGLWAESDPGATPPIRNRAVAELFVPRASSVRTADGALAADRAPVRASPTATQADLGSDAVRYDGDDAVPLVGVDRDARVGMAGGLLVDETYEQAEDFPVDTADYGQFPFVTNLLAWLAAPDRDEDDAGGGAVLIDGGHGQFGVDYALSSEDAAYYQRYLEGQQIAFDQRNRLSAAYLETGRALVVTPPVGSFGDGELDRLRAFRDDGGAVLLLGCADAPAYARANLDAVAAALGSDLRLNADRVHAATHNLDDDPSLPTTTRFDRSLPLFGAYTGEAPSVALAVEAVVADPAGPDRDALADETVTLANHGDPLELSGWTLHDVAGHAYDFPAGFELGAGDRVTIHTGDGDDDATDLYWGRASPVWNNDAAETVIVTNADDVEVLRAAVPLDG